MSVARVLRIATGGATRRCFSGSAQVPAACYLPVDQVKERVIDVVRSMKEAPSVIADNACFGSDLQFDSMLIKEVVSRLEDEFCVSIPTEKVDTMYGVEAAVSYFSSHTHAR